MRVLQLNQKIGRFGRPASLLLLTLLSWPGRLVADDWVTWPSTYTHDPLTGQRIDQFASGEQPLAPYRPDYLRSGYRHFRSTLQAGQSADNVHVVEQWGRPIVPYEQWRFPFRPYAVPYDAWGPQAPYGITNGYFGFGGPGYGGPGYETPEGFPGAGGAGDGWGSAPGEQGNGTSPAFSPTHGWQRPILPPMPSRGFPLTPTYRNEPWYDGTYPDAPPLGGR